MATTLEGFKDYAQLMPDDTDPTIELCYNAALEHAADAGIAADVIANNSKAALYIYATALFWHDHRDQVGVPLTVSHMAKLRRELMYAVARTPAANGENVTEEVIT